MGKAIVFVMGLTIFLFGVVAYGQEDTPVAGQSMISLLVILGVFGAVFYFLLIRPQRKRQAKHNELVKELKRGDKIVSAGGIYGEIESISETSIVVTVEDGSKLRFAKSSIVNKRAK